MTTANIRPQCLQTPFKSVEDSPPNGIAHQDRSANRLGTGIVARRTFRLGLPDGQAMTLKLPLPRDSLHHSVAGLHAWIHAIGMVSDSSPRSAAIVFNRCSSAANVASTAPSGATDFQAGTKPKRMK